MKIAWQYRDWMYALFCVIMLLIHQDQRKTIKVYQDYYSFSSRQRDALVERCRECEKRLKADTNYMDTLHRRLRQSGEWQYHNARYRLRAGEEVMIPGWGVSVFQPPGIGFRKPAIVRSSSSREPVEAPKP
jgi:hypothetical protein